MADNSSEQKNEELWKAAAYGNLAAVERALRAGADVNAPGGSDGRTALHEASLGGHRGVVQDLLEAGADLSLVDTWGWTALHLSSRGGHRDVVEALLQAGADHSLVDITGRTALHDASISGYRDVVEDLLKAGANHSLVDTLGKTPLMLARDGSHTEVVRLLELHQQGKKLPELEAELEADVKMAKKQPIDLQTLLQNYGTKRDITQMTAPDQTAKAIPRIRDLSLNTVAQQEDKMLNTLYSTFQKRKLEVESNLRIEDTEDLRQVSAAPDPAPQRIDSETKPHTTQPGHTTTQTSDVASDRTSKVIPLVTGHLANEEGIYSISESDITVSNPNNMECRKPDIFITSQPITEFEIPDGAQILSQMITLEPHGLVFDKHILVKFPINQQIYRPEQNVYLMYGDGSCGDDKEMHWVNISQNSKTVHKDEMFWFINHGFCYLFIRHFCHIFILQTSNDVTPQSGIYLLVSVYGKYVNEKLIITVGFHCDICFANLLEKKGKFGTLLADKSFCVYDGQGYITTHMSVDNNNGWECCNNEEQIDANQLLPLCHHKAIYHNKVEFRSIEDANVCRKLKIDVKVSQGRTERNFSVITCLKDITEQAKANVEVMTDFQVITHDLASSIDQSSGVALPQPTTAQITVSSAERVELEPEVNLPAAQNNIEPFQNNKQAVDNTPGESQMSNMGDLLIHPDELHNNCNMTNDQPPTGRMTTTDDLCTKPKHFDSSKPSSDVSLEPRLTLCRTQDNQKDSRDNRSLLLQGNSMNKVCVVPSSQRSRMQPYITQQYQGCQQIQGNNIQALAVNPHYVQYNLTFNQTIASNDSSLQLPETDCVFSRSVVSEQEKLCDIMDSNDCKAQLAEIAKAMGDTNGTVDMTLSLLQVWKIHVKEGKCSWREFYDLLVRLDCQSAAQQLKVVCDKDSLVKGINKLKQDISLDNELCGFLLEKDVIDLSESDVIALKQSPLEKISFLVLELLVKRPDNYWRVEGFFQALHSMRPYSEYIKVFMLCPEDLD